MITFLLCVAFLVVGYALYGKFVTKVFDPDDRETPAITLADGVDYVAMPTWKVFLIQLLNIAGTGPIFGALGGAMFGPVAYLWIIFGNIFAGAVHDFMCGMMSMRHKGASVSEMTGKYLGNTMLQVMRVFSVVLLVMCGVVFTKGPAGLLAMLTPETLNDQFWMWVIIVYYFIATFVPVDKVIGKVYPIFGFCLLFMAFGVGGVMLFSGNYQMPELWDNFTNMHAKGTPIWSFMFISIACGAISGFHATQSPMMARCCKSEKMGRRVFYGAMVMEGVIALVWCAAGVTFYESSAALQESGMASAAVYYVCNTAMGKAGAILALIGVVACPISSGDTAYRGARLTIADWLKIDQHSIKNRLLVTAPLLAVGVAICFVDYSMVWRYFSWCNQTLAMIMLWAAAVYLAKRHRNFWVCAAPATFMSAVSLTYFTVAPECLGLLWTALGMEFATYYPIGIVVGILAAVGFLSIFMKKVKPFASQPAMVD